MNQLGRGKAHAFRGFRDVLARELGSALPEVRGDVERVLEGTGGRTVEEGEEVKGEGQS
jgi:mediator of RNA polymerase II transcription subunit 10